jgi:hypothetical protein
VRGSKPRAASPPVAHGVSCAPPRSRRRFEDVRDAEDASRDLSGRKIRGFDKPVTVEISHGKKRERKDDRCCECQLSCDGVVL